MIFDFWCACFSSLVLFFNLSNDSSLALHWSAKIIFLVVLMGAIFCLVFLIFFSALFSVVLFIKVTIKMSMYALTDAQTPSKHFFGFAVSFYSCEAVS